MDKLTRDLRFGLRQLRLNPTFTIIAVLSLALGIGANTAIFQLIDAIRLRMLPVQKPLELASIDMAKGSWTMGWSSSRGSSFTYALWQSIRVHQQAFSETMAWNTMRFNLAEGGTVRYAEGLFVSSDFFHVLGVPAAIGRTFTAADDQPGCGSPAAVISYSFWQSEFGGDPSITTRTVRLDGRLFPILGVTPPNFSGVEIGRRFDVAIPLCADPMFYPPGKNRIPLRTAWWLSAIGRLKPGWTIAQADAQLRTASPAIMQESLPSAYRPDGAKKFLANKLAAMPGGTGVSQLRRRYQNPLWLLLAIAALVLLIACANLANLLLARASAREREIAVRQAIGASRRRLIAQLLSESLLLAFFGAAFGAVLAGLLSRGLVAFLTTRDNQMFLGLGIDWRVLGFTAAVALATCLLFGLAPALRATRVAPAFAMRSSARGLTAGRERLSLRRILVVAQVALSLVLLSGALLFVRSLQKLLAIDPGFQPDGIVAINLDLRPLHYSNERILDIRRQLLDELRQRTHPISAAQVFLTPVAGAGWDGGTWADGASNTHQVSLYNQIGPDYFRTMETAFVAGRDFNERDNLNSPKVAIVNEAFAKMFFNGRNPVGRAFRSEGGAGQPDNVYQIVGLVRNTKYFELREDFRPIAFLASSQDNNPYPAAKFVVRTSAPLGEFYKAATAALTGTHPGIGIDFTVLTTQIKDSLMRDRLMATLAGAFGLLAGFLAVLGLYGVIAYMVARRQNEIGVRIALGASRGRVIGLILREALLLLARGVIVGIALTAWTGQAAATLLYGLKPRDPLTLSAAVALLAIAALLASYGPAWRASRLDPMEALREE